MNKDITTTFKNYFKPKKVYKGGKGIPEKADRKIYKLSSNENPLGVSKKVKAAMEAAIDKVSQYPDQTDIRLREALEIDFKGEIKADQFICASSGSEILDIIQRAFINVGDEVIYSSPCFLPYSVFSRWHGASAIDVPLLEPNFDLNVEGIIATITPKTKIIFLASPSNPAGSYISKDQLEHLIAKVPKNIVLVLDEVYRHFADAEDYTDALPYIKEHKNIIALNSFSKTYGLAGLRLGYCYCDLDVATYIRQIHKPFLLPQIAIEAGIAALKDQDFVTDTVATVKRGKAYFYKEFDALGISYWPSQANFILIDPPIPEEEFTKLLFENGIMVRPVSPLGANGKVRISIGLQDANEAVIKVCKTIPELKLP